MNVFLYMTHPWFPVRDDRINVFLIPDLTVVHFPDLHEEVNRQHWAAYNEIAKRHADMVLTFSEATRADVVTSLGIEADRILAVPLAADQRFRPVSDPAALESDLSRWGLSHHNYILSVGTLEPRKNHGLILESFSRLDARGLLPSGCKLVFAGSKGWLYESIFERVHQLGLDEVVVFLGHADPLENLYAGATVMVYPSLMEGFGLPPLEAMACGTPVITSNTSSLPEVVGDAGITIDPHDADALAEAMSRVLNDPETRSTMRAQGLRRAAEFSWDKTAAGYLDALRQACRRKQSERV